MNAPLPSEEIIDRVADLLRSQVGLRPESTLRGRLRRCIRDEASTQGQEFESYVKNLSEHGDRMQSLLNRVTVQETGFFRHPEQFVALARDILPRLAQPLKIWSAGCANGQEAFSLAMLLDERGVDGSVIATDVSTSALQRTITARYTAREVSRLSPDRLARHFVKAGQTWEVNRSLRARISTVHHNLIDPVPEQARSTQVIFCRNVLIYFSPEHARTFLERAAQALPAAWLFLGSAETIWALGDRYETVRFQNTYVYRPLKAASPTAPAQLKTSLSRRNQSREFRQGEPDGDLKKARKVAAVPVPIATTRTGTRPVRAQSTTDLATEIDTTAIAALSEAGQQALAAGDIPAAVVMFRKWVYLAEEDALAHLHLALALEAGGDQLPAQRAFAAARRVLQETDPTQVEHAIDGYAAAELHKLLDAKQRGPTT